MSGYMRPQYNDQFRKKDDVNSFLFFIFLAIPGLRHMYLGAMKRGLHFLIAFFGLIAFGLFFGNDLEGLLLPMAAIVWFYSAFDSYQLRKMVRRGQDITDKPLFEDYGLDELKEFLSGKKYLFGVVAIILGAYLLVRRIRWYFRSGNIIFMVIDFIFDALIPLAMIVIGVYLLNKVRKDKRAKNAQTMVVEESLDEQQA